MNTKWKVDKDDFAKAIENNEYAEYELDDGTVLIKDVDSVPYIVAPESYTEDDVIHATEPESDMFSFDGLEFDHHNSSNLNASIWHIYGFEMFI